MIGITKLPNNQLGIEFPFNWEIINGIKKLKARHWDPNKKLWIIPSFELGELEKILPNEEFVKDFDVLKTKVPSTVDKQYQHSYKTPEYLYDHQKKSFKFFSNKECAADFSECGTGKTISMVALIDTRLEKNEADRVLIVCPKSIMESVWRTEIKKFLPKRSLTLLLGNTKEKKITLSALKSEIYIINFDSVRLLKEDLIRYFSNQMIVLDESTKIKNGLTQVSKTAIALGDSAKYRYIMTGTPTPNSLLEIYPQIRFLSPSILGYTFWQWRKEYFNAGGFKNYQWFAKPGTLNAIKSQLKSHSIRWKKEQCSQLPDITYNDRFVILNQKLMERYRTMKEDLIIKVKENKFITATNFLTRLIKLNEISNSFVIDNDGKVEWFQDDMVKMKELDEILEEVISNGNKAIIWSIYRAEIKKLTERYQKDYSPAILQGGMSDIDRVMNIKKFQEDPNCKIFIAHPRTAGHGINLSVANYSIWLSWDHSFESYEQANYRINRIGQKKKMTVIHIVAKNTIDRDIISNVRRKKKINYSILKEIETK